VIELSEQTIIEQLVERHARSQLDRLHATVG
jgi:hypothetical protein